MYSEKCGRLERPRKERGTKFESSGNLINLNTIPQSALSNKKPTEQIA